MAFLASARKYRPTRFDEVVGQEHVALTLKNALKNDKLAHAFLFCGPRGVGKTTCARILAKVLNCQNRGDDFEPCNSCESCNAFANNGSFNIIELDAASNNSVEHIRNLIEQVRFQPQHGKYKVFIIDEVHMLSAQAFNAFLKTLEEPPEYAVFILATTEKHKIIPTILSRCQIYDFKRIQVGRMVEHLQHIAKEENVKADPEALSVIAQKADGALRDSLSIFDRIAGSVDKEITYEDVIQNLNVLDYDYFFRFTEAMMAEDLTKVMLIFNEIVDNGFEPDIFINGMAAHLRNLLVAKDPATIQLLEQGEKLKKQYLAQAELTPASFLLSGLNILNTCDINYKMARNKRLHVELSLIKLTYINRAVSLAANAPLATPAPSGEKKKVASPPKVSEKTIVSVPIEKTVEPVMVKEPEQTVEPTPPPPPQDDAPKEKLSLDALMAEVEKEEEAAPVPIKEVLPAAEETTFVESTPNEAPEATAEPTESEVTAAEEETTSVEAPEPAPKEKLSLANLMAEVEEEEANKEEEVLTVVTLEALQEAWEKISDIKESRVNSFMKIAGVAIDGRKIIITVGSNLGKATITQESDIMEFLRKELKNKELIWEVIIDETMAPPKIEKPQKMTSKEIYQQMMKVNPLIKDALDRFDLKVEE